MIRNNLGWLYGTQNLSDLAIRHASEVAEKLPKHYKAILQWLKSIGNWVKLS